MGKIDLTVVLNYGVAWRKRIITVNWVVKKFLAAGVISSCLVPHIILKVRIIKKVKHVSCKMLEVLRTYRGIITI